MTQRSKSPTGSDNLKKSKKIALTVIETQIDGMADDMTDHPRLTQKSLRPQTPKSTKPSRTQSLKRAQRKAGRAEARKSKLPSSFKLFFQASKLMTDHWEVFGGTLLIYAILNFMLIGGVNGGNDLQTVKDSLGNVFTGQFSKLSTGLTLFTFLVTTGTGTTSGGIASAYQTVLLIIISLVLVWVCRQLYAGHKVRVRDGYYRGMQPLVPFVLVIMAVSLQLLPALVGGFLFKTLVIAGIVTVLWEQFIVLIICLALIVLTVYWICSSVFALYVVTLPEMTPLKALRSARDITRFRRASILRKLLFLPFALLIPSAIIMVPLALFATGAAIPVFFVITVIGVGFVHSYLYALYRELIA